MNEREEVHVSDINYAFSFFMEAVETERAPLWVRQAALRKLKAAVDALAEYYTPDPRFSNPVDVLLGV